MHRLSILAAVSTCCVLMACSRTEQPAHPADVPVSAVWAGGSDGGAWINCQFAYKEPFVAYSCNVFRDDGQRWASGTYVLADVDREQGHLVFHPAGTFARVDLSRYQAFDGVSIYLNGSRVLIPNGAIDFPFSEGHGKALRMFSAKKYQRQSTSQIARWAG
jgi:hypothetical protein